MNGRDFVGSIPIEIVLTMVKSTDFFEIEMLSDVFYLDSVDFIRLLNIYN